MVSIADYKVIGVSERRIIEDIHKRGAPSDNWLCSWGKRKQVAFVLRYFPSKKAWAVLDIRHAIEAPIGHGFAWKHYRRHPKYWPSEDAAVMYAVSQTGTTS